MARGSMTLDELVKQLSAAYGNALKSVVLYGSAASGEQVSGKSDQNVLVIVDRIDRTRMQQLAQTTRGWSDAGNPPPLTLTNDEWMRSADIFPMEYADILERHKVLHGVPPFEGIHVRASDLRLQVEHEAMGVLLKLRAGVMMAGTEAKQQRTLLTDSLSALMVVFRATLRLNGQVPARDYSTVAKAVSQLAAFDVAPFERAIAFSRESKGSAPSDVAATLDAYVEGMERLVAYLDRFVVVP